MFKKFNGNVSKDIKMFEKNVKMKLPDDYKNFMLHNNGGVFVDEMHTFWVEELQETICIDVLFGFNLEFGLNLADWYEEYFDDLLDDMIIIGNTVNAGLLLLVWQDDWKGIYLWDNCLEFEQSTEEECIYKISDRFDTFMDSMKIMSDDEMLELQ